MDPDHSKPLRTGLGLGMTAGQIGRPSRVGDPRGRMLTPESSRAAPTAATSSYEGTVQ